MVSELNLLPADILESALTEALSAPGPEATAPMLLLPGPAPTRVSRPDRSFSWRPFLRLNIKTCCPPFSPGLVARPLLTGSGQKARGRRR